MLAHNLSMDVVAEGVTEEQLRHLRRWAASSQDSCFRSRRRRGRRPADCVATFQSMSLVDVRSLESLVESRVVSRAPLGAAELAASPKS